MKTRPLSVLIFVLATAPGSMAFSMTMSSSQVTQQNRFQLQQALYSPSGKLTLSPEIVIPEPTDPTALLLQASAISTLSERIRTAAKANAAGIDGSVNSVRSFVVEQEGARGNFPGPVPVIYCGSVNSGESGSEECAELMKDLGEAGASGVVVPVLGGSEVTSAGDVSSDEGLESTCAAALANGVLPIPEIVLPADCSWEEKDVEDLVASLSEKCGSEPVAVVLSVNAEEGESDDDNTEAKEEPLSLPKVPKALGKRVPIIGSVRVMAGENRMGSCVAQLKEAGFTGAFLRSDCVPGFRMNPDLDVVGGFWSAAIGDLKSTKSKSFSFRSKVIETNNVPSAWYNYQKDVMSSGALGKTSEESDLDTSAGDYKGF